MNHYILNIALIYFISASAATLISLTIFKVRFLGNFWGALIMSLVGSFTGGAIGSLMPVIYSRVLQSFMASLAFAFMFLLIFRWISIITEY